MTQKKLQKRMYELYERSIESSDLKYDGNLSDIDYFGLFCKATSQDKLFRMVGCNLCIFNYIHENDDSALFLFSIPFGVDSGNKQIADKIMEIITLMEKCFVVLDYIDTNDVKDDKFVYVIIIKKIRK